MLGSVWIYSRSQAKKNIQRDKYIAQWNTHSYMGILIHTDTKFEKPYLDKY